MTVMKFSTRFNSLIQYAFSVANNDKGKMKIFINRLRLNIAKDVLTRDNPPKSYSDMLNRALR